MPGLVSNPIFVGAAAAILSIVCTFAVRAFAVRRGIVAKPKSDRWHKRPTAMLGGVAIFIATAAIYFMLVPYTRESLVVFGGSAFLFAVGLLDDILSIRPYQKLIGQLIGAGILVLSGLKLPLTGFEIIDIWITVFWVIGITNAINLLDNMDGLATGIAAIASAFLTFNFVASGQTTEALMLGVFTASLIGFLIYNSNPASIFMG